MHQQLLNFTNTNQEINMNTDLLQEQSTNDGQEHSQNPSQHLSQENMIETDFGSMSQAYPKGFRYCGDPNNEFFKAANFLNKDDGEHLNLISIFQAVFNESMRISQIS